MAGKTHAPNHPNLPLPLQFIAAWLAVWIGRIQQQQIDYLKAENRVLKEAIGDRKIRLSNATVVTSRSWARPSGERPYPRSPPLPRPIPSCGGIENSSPTNLMEANFGHLAEHARGTKSPA